MNPERFLRRRVSKAKQAGYSLYRNWIDPQFGYQEDDIVMSGFQKSGNNWVGFLIVNTVSRSSGRDVDIHFRNLNDWFSSTFPEQPPVEGFQRMLTTHDEYQGQDTKSIYILRHPADVLESYHHYLEGRWNRDMGEFSEFIRTEEFGAPAWKRHVESWEGNWDVLVKFEELKEDPKAQLRTICKLFEKEISEETLDYAVEQASFENMAQMEKKYGLPKKHGANSDYTFMRKGESNQGAGYFNDEDYRYLWESAGDVMKRYGYDVPVDV